MVVAAFRIEEVGQWSQGDDRRRRSTVGGGVDDEHRGSSKGLERAKRRCRGEELVWWQNRK